jgi:hypothetical protein
MACFDVGVILGAVPSFDQWKYAGRRVTQVSAHLHVMWQTCCMPRNIDVNSVVRPLAQDAPKDAIRRQQIDTALLVGQVVSNLRGAILARVEEKAREPRDVKPRFDAQELEKELAALHERLNMCRRNLEGSAARNQAGKLRFLKLGEKRAAALTEALERLHQRR